MVSVPVADEILRAWFEITGKRPRGKVLPRNPMYTPNEDGVVPSATPSASPEASPIPGTPTADD